MAALCDVYVMDAFGTAHRAQASTRGGSPASPPWRAPARSSAPSSTRSARPSRSRPRPLVAIVGGSKVSTKPRSPRSALGAGRSAHHRRRDRQYLHRRRRPRGGEPRCTRRTWSSKRSASGTRCAGAAATCPSRATWWVADAPADAAVAAVKGVGDVGPGEMILDIGPDTARAYRDAVESAGTVVWNGPVGVFEIEAFSAGTRELAQSIARSPGVLDRGRRATPSRPSTHSASPDGSRTSRPVAAPSSSSSKAGRSPQSRRSKPRAGG